jgi:CheY-like chemotaxis protein
MSRMASSNTGMLPRILVVEDEADIRESLALLLAQEGYEVVEASDGEEGLARLRGGGPRPCAILLDLHMPRKDGEEFRREQLEDAAIADIPVILLSGIAPAELRRRRIPASAIVRKPIDVHHLGAVLKALCAAN